MLYQIGDLIGRKLALSADWLNQAVKRVAPPPGGAEPNLTLFGEYPRHSAQAVGLRVFLPTPAYVLAMKLLANRGDGEPLKTQSDLRDMHGLMRISGTDTFDAMAALLRECYPHLPGISSPTLNPRLAAKIASVLDTYAPDPPSADPTWNAGRGPATRPP